MFISFGSINIKWIFFLLVPLLLVLCNMLQVFIMKEKKYDNNLFYFAFLKFVGRSFSLIFWIALNKSLSFQKNNGKVNLNGVTYKRENVNVSISILDSILFENIKNEKKISIKKRKSILFMIVTSLLDYIATTIKFIFSNIDYRMEVSGGLIVLCSCVRLLVFALLSYFILKNKNIKKHQYFSVIVIAIVVLIIFILSISIENEENNDNYIIKLLLMITPEIIYCFMYICGIKYLMKSQGNVYKLIFFNGIIGLILSGIFQIILSFFNCNDIKDLIHSIFEICDNSKIKTIINNFKSFDNFGGYLALLLIFFNFIEIICIWLLIFYFSPNHFAAIYTIPSFIEIIFVKNQNNKYLYIIGAIIIILMTLIYNEIIILKFCGLDKETKNEICKRAINDSNTGIFEEEEETIKNDNEDNYSNDNFD